MTPLLNQEQKKQRIAVSYDAFPNLMINQIQPIEIKKQIHFHISFFLSSSVIVLPLLFLKKRFGLDSFSKSSSFFLRSVRLSLFVAIISLPYLYYIKI